jgi:hypothetical protein
MAPPLLLVLTLALFALPRRGGLGNRVTAIKKDERVVLFPTLSKRLTVDTDCSADYADAAGWEVPIHGWVFEPEESSLRRRAFVNLLRRALDLERGEEASDILKRRVRPFLCDNERGKALTLELVGGRGGAGGGPAVIARKRMPRSHRDGHFRGSFRISDRDVAAFGRVEGDTGGDMCALTVRIVHPDEDRLFAGTTHLLPPTGLSVISDIDDTIKLSNVLDKRELMRNTFLKEFHAVPGMAALYQQWAERRGANFHFVSSSPWQLYEAISNFMQRESFPSGSFHLKQVRVKPASIANLLKDPFLTKVRTIEDIVKAYPQRHFVLVGDTGERDPEVYGEMCRRFPNNILRVYLRDAGEESTPERFDKAFAGVSNELWTVFSDPSAIELPE